MHDLSSLYYQYYYLRFSISQLESTVYFHAHFQRTGYISQLFIFSERRQKIEDIKKNIRDAILVSTHFTRALVSSESSVCDIQRQESLFRETLAFSEWVLNVWWIFCVYDALLMSRF